jgi:pyruvate/2-oxoglutarate dehydrogenase complex dihydrolipoamide acyltransferase (E2) component
MVAAMIYQLVVPAMGGVEELRVLQWHKAEGDTVDADQLVVELETDKAIVEVRSPRGCVLRKIGVTQGDWAKVGPPLAWFSDTADETLQTDKAGDFMPLWEIV